MDPDIASLAALIGEPTRTNILLALFDGRALPAGELAFRANVAPQTASGHLVKLVKAGLLKVETHGRHRYYRIASAEVAFAIETLGALAPPRRESSPESEETRTFRFARTCYNHLAGILAVKIAGAMQQEKLITDIAEKHCQLTEQGRLWLAALGVEIKPDRLPIDGVGRYCPDWTERRRHLSGPLGRIILSRLCDLGWLARMSRTRALRLTVAGRIELDKRLGLCL